MAPLYVPVVTTTDYHIHGSSSKDLRNILPHNEHTCHIMYDTNKHHQAKKIQRATLGFLHPTHWFSLIT